MAYQQLSEKAMGLALAILGGLAGLAGIAWHGYMRQPSIMQTLYPGWTWSASNSLMLIVGFAICGYVTGYLSAWLYNRALKKKY